MKVQRSTSKREIFLALFFVLSFAATIWLWSINGQHIIDIKQQNIQHRNDNLFSLSSELILDDTVFFLYPSDDNTNSQGSGLKIYENGKALGPAHSSHAAIASIGGGQFSHWKGYLFFSSSDHTDPLSNGNNYHAIYDGVPTQALMLSRLIALIVCVSLFILMSFILRRFIVVRIYLSTIGLLCGGFALAHIWNVVPPHEYKIPTDTIRPYGEKGFIVNLDAIEFERYLFELPADTNDDPHKSKLRFLINGKEYGVPHSNHTTIREVGGEVYSHWGSDLLFSFQGNELVDTEFSVSYRLKIKQEIALVLLLSLLLPLLFLVLAGRNLFLALDKQYAKKHGVGEFPDDRYILQSIAVFPRFLIMLTIFSIVFLVPFFGLYYNVENDSLKRTQNRDISSISIFEQLLRTEMAPPGQIIFFGDSSCLTGVNVDILNEQSEHEYANYCTIAYLGPKGYATILDSLPETAIPTKLVYMMHPSSFQRDPSWNSWIDFVESRHEKIPTSKALNWKAFTEWVFENVLTHVVFMPMDGPYGIYYGNRENLRQNIETKGMFIDPVRSLHANPSFESVGVGGLDPKSTTYQQACPFLQNLEPNQEYWKHLAELKNFLERRGITQLYMVIGPVYAICNTDVLKAELNSIMAQHQNLFGDIEVIQMAPDVDIPYGQFSTSTHLNRFGRDTYTRALIKVIEAK